MPAAGYCHCQCKICRVPDARHCHGRPQCAAPTAAERPTDPTGPNRPGTPDDTQALVLPRELIIAPDVPEREVSRRT